MLLFSAWFQFASCAFSVVQCVLHSGNIHSACYWCYCCAVHTCDLDRYAAGLYFRSRCSSKDGHQGCNPLPGSHRRAAVDAVNPCCLLRYCKVIGSSSVLLRKDIIPMPSAMSMLSSMCIWWTAGRTSQRTWHSTLYTMGGWSWLCVYPHLHLLEYLTIKCGLPSLGCIPSLVKIGSGNAHCLLAGVHETLESSHQAQWPRGGHISHVFLLYSTVSWPSFIESIHALELS